MRFISVSIVPAYTVLYVTYVINIADFVLFIIVEGNVTVPTFINHTAHAGIILYYTFFKYEQEKPIEVLLDIPFCAL